jgi:lysophospholipase L1-like esterase
MRWRTFVALGDSFTEGVGDEYPDGSGCRGWADLVAARLAAEAASPGWLPDAAPDWLPDAALATVRYANLAVRGRLFGPVVDQQVPTAMAMRPDLVSFAAGGNDALRPGFDMSALVTRVDSTVERCRATGADVLLFRCADFTPLLPARRVLRPRIEALNAAVTTIGQRHGARVVDLWADDGFADPQMWCSDRLHLSTVGHHRTAAAVLRVLGVTPDPAWLGPSAGPDPGPWISSRAADLRWFTRYLVPWIGRRVTGRSSGDARPAKRPVPEPFGLPDSADRQ